MNQDYINFLLEHRLKGEEVISVHSSLGACIGAMVVPKELVSELEKILNISIWKKKRK